MLQRLFHRLLIGLAAVVGLYLLLAFVGILRVYRSPTSSMEPTLQAGDHLLTTNLTKNRLERGTLVIFDPGSSLKGTSPNMHLKRLVALPGDVIEVRGNEMLVNRIPLPTRDGPSMPQRPVVGYPPIAYPLTVPKGHVYLVGDHYANSLDSRYFGPVPIGAIRMKPFVRIWPLSSFGSIR
jgi:signal peptidase I